ncbi:MAG: hypothetical protein GX557_15595 [Chloroflexi bacterium]|nr:hypothetical protein [Chloroflexota bacterium]
MQAYENTLIERRPLVKLLGLSAAIIVALAVLSFGWPQAITGVLINALLLLTALYVGLPQALILGLITPLGGTLRGVLPLPMAVMIPFIALGNATFVSVYSGLRGRNGLLALAAGALAKFALLAGVVTLLQAAPLTLTAGNTSSALVIPPAFAGMMTWPQLANALAGGLLAEGVRWWQGRKARRDA